MKTTTIRICTLAIACCAGLTFAQDGGKRAGGGEGAIASRLADFIKKVDTNGDGKITKEEFLTYSKKEAEERFAKMDTNGDGVVDETEIKAAAEKIREAGMRRGEGQGEGGFRRPPGSEAGKEPGAAPARRERAQGERPQGERAPGSPEGGPPRGGPGMGAMMGNPEEFFKKIDKNGDGIVDAAEYRAFAAEEADERFKRFDTKGNGKVTLDEFKDAIQKMREMMRRGAGEGGARRPGGEGGQGGFRRPPSGDAPQSRPRPEGDKKPEDAK